MEIGERTGDEVLWAKGAESGGWHLIAAGELNRGFAQMERALEVVDRERRSLLAWMALNIRGQMSWGLGSPDEAQGFFDRHIALPYVGETSFRRRNGNRWDEWASLAAQVVDPRGEVLGGSSK